MQTSFYTDYLKYGRRDKSNKKALKSLNVKRLNTLEWGGGEMNSLPLVSTKH